MDLNIETLIKDFYVDPIISIPKSIDMDEIMSDSDLPEYDDIVEIIKTKNKVEEEDPEENPEDSKEEAEEDAEDSKEEAEETKTKSKRKTIKINTEDNKSIEISFNISDKPPTGKKRITKDDKIRDKFVDRRIKMENLVKYYELQIKYIKSKINHDSIVHDLFKIKEQLEK